MRLIELRPQFIRLEYRTETWSRVLGDPMTWKQGDPVEQVTGQRDYYVPVDTLAEAHGIMFTCPKCLRPETGGGHKVLCWFVGKVDDNVKPNPGRWTPVGTGYHDLSFVNSPGRTCSVLLDGPGCGWHGLIVKGEVTLKA